MTIRKSQIKNLLQGTGISGNREEFVIGCLRLVICHFSLDQVEGTQVESVRRILCLKLLPMRSNAGWCLLR